MSEGNRAVARDVLHTAIIVRPLTAIHDKHAELHSLASQLEWKPMLDFICLLPGYGPFWANKLAYDLRRAGLARRHPRDRLSYCLWGLTGPVHGLRRITGLRSLEPAVCRAWSRSLLQACRQWWPYTIQRDLELRTTSDQVWRIRKQRAETARADGLCAERYANSRGNSSQALLYFLPCRSVCTPLLP